MIAIPKTACKATQAHRMTRKAREKEKRKITMGKRKGDRRKKNGITEKARERQETRPNLAIVNMHNECLCWLTD
jgi:hypothetical protein